MSAPPDDQPKTRNWRDIPQEIAPRRMSSVGRRRLTLGAVRTLASIVAIGAITWGGYGIWRTFKNDPQRLAAVSDSRPVEEIELKTDGVLDQEWLAQTLDMVPTAGLMELDLYAMRSRLTASGQVRRAVLVREFPATLKVILEERSPVVRLKARLGGPDARTFMVAQDGTVFDGTGYETSLVRSMPWLGGVRLLREGDGFQPLEGMDRLTNLLSTARNGVPRRYATWRVVSLARMSSDGQILVQTTDVPEIIFGVREDFYSQIARMDLILAETKRRSAAPVRSIDLSVGAAQVPVALNQPTTNTPDISFSR
ncbi:MAG: cell division protein FtsQ/DivIB, partial [Verrucomicrobiia bacterium]|tara:strand:- start:4254 stop:5186 length:933 start_codon:yes stop_codon:yes gene_type:complete